MSKKTRKKYDASFKREAVRIADQSGKPDSHVEKDLGLFQGAIRHWREELKRNPKNVFRTSQPTIKIAPENTEHFSHLPHRKLRAIFNAVAESFFFF